MIKEEKLFQLRIVLGSRTFGVLYKCPPTKEDVNQVFRREWNKLSIQEQDRVWEWLLILERLPESGPIPLKTESIYGTLEVVEKAMVINE